MEQNSKMANVSQRLAHAPLVYAICELRFPTILKMEGFIPDIQERLRKQYELFNKEELRGIQIMPSGPTLTQTEIRWRFDRRDKRCGYIVTQDRLVFHTTAYEHFELFLQEVTNGMEHVSAVASINLVQRMGLRYVDYIVPAPGRSLNEYVRDSLLGFEPALDGLKAGQSTQFHRFKTSNGRLQLRLARGKHKTVLPNDLMPMGLKVGREPVLDRDSLILDTDHFVEGQESRVDQPEIEGHLRALKEPIARIFRDAVTDFARAEWSKA